MYGNVDLAVDHRDVEGFGKDSCDAELVKRLVEEDVALGFDGNDFGFVTQVIEFPFDGMRLPKCKLAVAGSYAYGFICQVDGSLGVCKPRSAFILSRFRSGIPS